MNRFELYLEVVRKVPAYSRLLGEGGGISEVGEWERLPVLTKKNYLLNHPLTELCRAGDFANVHLIGASSGFGKDGTVYWPKRPRDEAAYVAGLREMFADHYHTDEKRTLIMVCLAFGMWIGGMQLAAGIRQLAASGEQRIACATPGLNLEEAVGVVKEFGDQFEQVLIVTNPSNVNLFSALFSREDVACGAGKFSFPVVGEYFSESFRLRMAERFGHQPDDPFCLWTGFGSADAGDLGYETAASIALRKYFYARPELSREFFGTSDTPMIFAKSEKAFIEIIDGEIIVTKDQFIPLVRYNTQDRGGLIRPADLDGIIPEELGSELPGEMLYVGGRTSDSVIFYGTNLTITDINHMFISLDESYGYGGLFEVCPETRDGISYFTFNIYTDNFANEQLAGRYHEVLLDFLKRSSLEFAAKYDNLARAAGGDLVTVKLKDVKLLSGNLKHRFIVEDENAQL